MESTVFVGGAGAARRRSARASRRRRRLRRPSTSGYASRSHYFWAGASYQRTPQRSATGWAASTSYSLVYGYRPPAWRLDYPKPDLRFFVEARGDSTARHVKRGNAMSRQRRARHARRADDLAALQSLRHRRRHPVSVLPAAEWYATRERFRFGVNFTYFFWPGTVERTLKS